jgi:hypothetical protein
MNRALKDRAKRNGRKSKYAGDEPRNNELTVHLPRMKIKRRHFPSVSKKNAQRRRKARIKRHAAAALYEARLVATWALYVDVMKGG